LCLVLIEVISKLYLTSLKALSKKMALKASLPGSGSVEEEEKEAVVWKREGREG